VNEPIPRADREVLRPLAEEVARLAARPADESKRREWKRLNALRPGRPLVHICQEPWREFPDCAPRSQSRLGRELESQLRRKLWRAEHAPVDDPVEAEVWTMSVFQEEPWGLPLPQRSPDLALGAIEYHSLIRSEADVARIALPAIAYDAAATRAKIELIRDACGGLIAVNPHVPLAPAMWDLLVQWYGTNELMQDLAENPGLVHAAARRCTDMVLHRMNQWEDQGALVLNNAGQGAGSGGLGYTDELPSADFAGRVRLKDLWGNQMAQIFVGVSPRMHDEFALRYEIEILSRFGLNNYGCCEPLHHKVAILRKIPRLRRISMSPWVDWAASAEAVGTEYIYSAKPNPAYLAGEGDDLGPAREQLRRILAATRGLKVEVVLKDIHTLRGEPHRLAAWARMAMELVERMG
jgi:hypothetical protein